MTFYILDPNLVHAHGHHLEWDLRIAEAVIEREQDVVIVSHIDFDVSLDQRITVIPHFTSTIYESRSKDRVTGRYDDFSYYNDKLFAELLALPLEMMHPTDAVLIPTLNENHLLGYITWIKTFDQSLAPLFIVHLMFPSGLDIDRSGLVTIVDDQQSIFYKLAFRQLPHSVSYLHFFGGGRQLAREFSALTERKIEPHALPLCPTRSNSLIGNGRRKALLFAGDAKASKGVTLLPDLIAKIAPLYPNWDFTIHANSGQSWGDALKACEQLAVIQSSITNFRLYSGRLESDAYLRLLEDMDAVVFTYDPVEYARKSSGVLWESVSMGIPVLIPAATWLAKEAEEWRAGFLEYGHQSADAIVEAFGYFADRIEEFRSLSMEASRQYQSLNGSSALVDQIAQLWIPRLMAASMTAMPEAFVIEMTELTGAHWHELENDGGRLMRWSGKELVIDFKWPHSLHWQIEIEVRKYIGVDQVQNAKATLSDVLLPIQCTLNNDDSAVLIIDGTPGSAQLPDCRLRVTLPYTYRPPHESRDLGIFVAQVVLRPKMPKGVGKHQASGHIEVLSHVEWDSSRRRFLMRECVSGVANLDPHAGVEFKLTLETDGGPKAVRGLRLFINGCAVRASCIALDVRTWSWMAICPPHLIARAGYKTDWDITAKAELLQTPIWLCDLSIAGKLVDRPGGVSHVQPKATFLPSDVDESKWMPSENGCPNRSTEFTGRVAGIVAGTWESGLSDAHGDAVVTAEDLRLNEYHSTGNYRHLDISLMSPALEDFTWPHVRFKFAVHEDRRSVEIRKFVGWPDMFVNWPSAEEDSFSPFVRFYESTASANAVRSWVAPRDRMLIKMVMMILPAAVDIAANKATQPDMEASIWHEEAVRFSSNFLDLLGSEGSETY